MKDLNSKKGLFPRNTPQMLAGVMNDLFTSILKMFTTCGYLNQRDGCQRFSQNRRSTDACSGRPCLGMATS